MGDTVGDVVDLEARRKDDDEYVWQCSCGNAVWLLDARGWIQCAECRRYMGGYWDWLA